MPLILPGNVATTTASTGYEVANSLRFNSGDSADMVYTPSSTGSRRTFTWSVWVKRTTLGASQQIFTKKEGSGSDNNGNGNADYLALTYFNSDDTLTVARNQEGDYINVSVANRKFRDIGAWYHILAAIDTTQGTGSNRVKCWVNGEAQTLTFTTTPTQNRDLDFNQSGEAHHLGSYGDGSSSYFSGYLAECVLLDGTAVSNATDFGEFDSDSPQIWKPKDVSGLTFGTNGFYLDFENSSSLGNDAAGSNNFGTVNNLAAIDQCTDTCTNNFAVPNILLEGVSMSYNENNLEIVISEAAQYGTQSSFGMTAGKWYCELKHTANTSAGNDRVMVGIVGNPVHLSQQGAATSTEGYVGASSEPTSYGYYGDTGKSYQNSNATNYGNTWTINDIIGIYLDCDNNKLYFSKNGTIQNSGTGISITAPASTTAGAYFFAFTDTSSYGGTVQVNFGGATCYSISSAVSDANGYGSFEYSPSGTFDSASKDFLALCTKNLGSDGG